MKETDSYKANWEEIFRWLQRGQESLKVAQLSFAKGLFAPAISRAYYVSFYAAHAAILAQKTPSTLKTHVGLQTLFTKHLIKSNKLPKQLGHDLGYLFEMRQRADYDVKTQLHYRDAKQTLEIAEKFLNVVTQFINAVKPKLD